MITDQKKVCFCLCTGIYCFLSLMGCGPNINNEQNISQNIEEEKTNNYDTVDIGDMIADFDHNALRANVKYKGAYVKIINGQIDSIESDESYFALNDLRLKVYPQNDEQKIQIKELFKGQLVTVYGKVIDVREIKGYTVALMKLDTTDIVAKHEESTNTKENEIINRSPQTNYSTQTDTTNLFDSRTPEGLFRLYHLAITDHQLSIAYNYFSDDFKSQIEYSSWASGYDTTLESIPEEVITVSNDGYRATLIFSLKAVDQVGTSAKVQYFIGECNLIKVNGIWKIDSISARYA